MNRMKTLIGIFAFSLMLLVLPSAASAQWGDDDNWRRNDNRYGYRDVRVQINNLKNRGRTFERLADRYDDRRDDRGRLGDIVFGGNRGRGGDLENLARSFRSAVDDLSDAYGRGRNLNNSRDEAQRLMQIARQINQEMRGSRAGRDIRYEWNEMSKDLGVIADAYGMRYNRGNNRNRNDFPF